MIIVLLRAEVVFRTARGVGAFAALMSRRRSRNHQRGHHPAATLNSTNKAIKMLWIMANQDNSWLLAASPVGSCGFAQLSAVWIFVPLAVVTGSTNAWRCRSQGRHPTIIGDAHQGRGRHLADTWIFNRVLPDRR